MDGGCPQATAEHVLQIVNSNPPESARRGLAVLLRRIGHDEIDNLIRQRTQHASAITLKNLIDREHGGASASIGGIADARPQSRRAQRSRIEDRRRRRVRPRARP